MTVVPPADPQVTEAGGQGPLAAETGGAPLPVPGDGHPVIPLCAARGVAPTAGHPPETAGTAEGSAAGVTAVRGGHRDPCPGTVNMTTPGGAGVLTGEGTRPLLTA